MKKRTRISFFLLLSSILFLFFSGTAFSWSGETWVNMTRDEIWARGNDMINLAWSPNQTFDSWISNGTGWRRYYTGTWYYGIAYNPNNPQENIPEFQYQVSHIPYYGADYNNLGNDCSGYVSMCWKLPTRYATMNFGSDANASGGYVDSLGGYGTSATANLQKGDACNDAGSHIVMVESISSSGGVNAMEQSPSLDCGRRYWSWSSLAGYQPIRRRQITAPPPPPPPPPPPSGCTFLRGGQYLTRGQAVCSCNGKACLWHQNDGNVVAYDRIGALWSTGTNGRATTIFVMQTDGNLVLYNGGTAIWHTGTHGNPGAYMAMQDDCNLVIYNSSGRAIWATMRFCR